MHPHKNIVALVLRFEDGSVLLGKHASGPHQGEWGIPTIDSSIDRRPQVAASRLARTATIGMQGRYREIEDGIVSKTVSAMGARIYETPADFSLQDLNRTCNYLRECFPHAEAPAGLIPWTLVDSAIPKLPFSAHRLDKYTIDVFQTIQK